MRALIALISVSILSLSTFAIDERVTLRFLLTESVDFFSKKEKEVQGKLRGLSAFYKMGQLDDAQMAVLNKEITRQQCRHEAYEMLHKIASMYKKEDALSSAFITRTELTLDSDDMRSMFDFFIQPYLEFLNYKTDYLTAVVNKRDYRTNEAMPYYLSELNVDGFCDRRTRIHHPGENKAEVTEALLAIPPRVAVDSVARSKNYVKFAEIRAVEKFAEREKNKAQDK